MQKKQKKKIFAFIFKRASIDVFEIQKHQKCCNLCVKQDSNLRAFADELESSSITSLGHSRSVLYRIRTDIFA